MTTKFNVRLAGRGDLPALGRIYFRAIRVGVRPKYSYAQRRVWAYRALSARDLRRRLNGHTVVVAVDARNLPQGFMTLSRMGYIDLAFIAPEHIGKKLARLMFAALETIALAQGYDELSTHASLMAAPVFSSFGFHRVERETVDVRGVPLDRYFMKKTLSVDGA